jgi:hypothetical protein
MPVWFDTTLIVGAIAGVATLVGVAARWGSRLVVVEHNQESTNANIHEIKTVNSFRILGVLFYYVLHLELRAFLCLHKPSISQKIEEHPPNTRILHFCKSQ